MNLSIAQKNWLLQGTALLLVLALVVLAWLPGYQLLLHIWDSNGTYTHCYLVLPITLYLIWRIRHQWLMMEPGITWPALGAVFLSSLLYSLGHLGDLAGIQHIATVLVMMSLLTFFAGRDVACLWLFPIAYLVFAIPFGEALLPSLMHFTADFTVFALQVVGIPVYREGLFFTLPSGNWSVVEACSGLRYLIASLALGTLYAYLNYRSWKRRLIFFAVCAIVPIFANGMRAFLIVTLGHISDMRLAVGIDHYIYGWLFFTLVIFLLFWVGSFWREDEELSVEYLTHASTRESTVDLRRLGLATLLCLFAALTLPLAERQLKRHLVDNPYRADLQKLAAQWGDRTIFTSFIPHYRGGREQINQQIILGAQPTGIFVAHYSGQDTEHKLISITNKLVVSLQKEANLVSQNQFPLATTTQELPREVNESRLRYVDQNLLTWHWFEVCGQQTASETRAKLLQLQCTLTQGNDSASIVVLYVQQGQNLDQARAHLQQTMLQVTPPIRAVLSSAKK